MKTFTESELRNFIEKIVIESINDKRKQKNRLIIKESEFRNILENSVIQILKEDYGYNLINSIVK
jgi:hypothetical protein